jgi:hypothetical protein
MTTGDVELLRRAAARMRELAEEAQHYTRRGRWEAERVYQESWTVIPIGIMDSDYDLPREQRDGDTLTRIHREEAKHIAAWDPIVALTVAVWLDDVAQRDDAMVFSVDHERNRQHPGDWTPALTIARAFLREEPPAANRPAGGA